MKLILLILFSFTLPLPAQWNTAAIKLGIFDPAAADGGFIIGYEGGPFVDYGFSFGWSIDWFHRDYVDKKLVSEFNDYRIAGGSINELRAKTNLHDFPLMLNAAAKFPVSPLVKMFVTGGIGAEILFIHYRNFQNPDESEFQAAFDFNWRAGIGVVYELGYSSEIFGEIDYHRSMPSWTYKVEEDGTERFFEREFDMSGMMLRIGFRFYY